MSERRILQWWRSRGVAAVLAMLLAGMSGTLEAADAPEPRDAREGRETRQRRQPREGYRDSQVVRAFQELEMEGTWRWLESGRDRLSRNVTSVGRSLDDWLSGESVGEHSNESYLRIKLNQRVGRHNAYHSDLSIGGRVDLPQTAERWRLIFDSRTEERNSLREQRVGDTYPSSFTGGFSYELDEIAGWQFSQDFGLRADIPPDPFYRIRSHYGHSIGDNWHGEINQRLFYYHSDGWGQDTRIHFSRDVGNDFYLRLDSQANYRHQDREVELAQSVSLNQSLSEFETLTYELGVIGGNKPDTQVQDYYAQMQYRNAIHEDWLVLEVVPQLLSERENDWQLDPRLQFNLEIYFYDF